MTRKFGSLERFEAFKKYHGLVPRGEEVGVRWTEAELSTRQQSSTLRSHRLVQWAAQRYSSAAAESLYSALGRRHFREGGALNDTALLLAAATEVDGLDSAAAAAAFLATNEGEQQVLDTVERVHELGINSIPTLVIDGRPVLQGGARVEDVIHALRSMQAPTGARLFADLITF
mmetsp:Transcript_15432/g.31721  ORF Transcript_15432/g.31721 Transcript_15432/m.31721 type:complete len:174 (+) Transcript_15432:244-765(+)